MLFLSLFNIVRGFVSDYLHCILLGVVRSFVDLWSDSCNHHQPWYISFDISRKIVSMKIPSSISRLPRGLSERKFWKGSEWKSFLIFYSLIVLDGKLSRLYLNHWFLLVFATNILLQDKVSQTEVDLGDKALKHFVKKVPILYGGEFCTFNVHQLLHIADAVRDWGPLWGFSCFRFENNIGEILSLVRGKKCVRKQICKTFLLHRLIPIMYSKYFTVCDMQLDSLFNRLICSGKYARKWSTCADNVHLYGSANTRLLTTREILAFSHLYGSTPKTCSYKVYDRFSFNSIFMCSFDYKESNRHCDDTVQLTNSRICVIVRCIVGQFFCYHQMNSCECDDKVLIFVHEVEKTNDRPLFSSRELQISSSSFLLNGHRNQETVCLEPVQVARKCFGYQRNDKCLIIPLPTSQELDK